MKLAVFFFILSLSALTSCSNSKEQDNVLVVHMNTILDDQDKWISALQNFDANNETSQNELKRIYFSNHATSFSTYSNVLLVISYFNINRDLAVKYRNLLDKRDLLCGSFYTCKAFENEKAKELIRVEQKTLDLMNQINNAIQDEK